MSLSFQYMMYYIALQPGAGPLSFRTLKGVRPAILGGPVAFCSDPRHRYQPDLQATHPPARPWQVQVSAYKALE